MEDWERERLERLRGWAADLERMLAEAERVGDSKVMEAAGKMLEQCRLLISQAPDEFHS